MKARLARAGDKTRARIDREVERLPKAPDVLQVEKGVAPQRPRVLSGKRCRQDDVEVRPGPLDKPKDQGIG